MSAKIKKLMGFTLIEILVVIALIAILASITIVAINPAKAFQDARNTQRSANVSVILNAVTQYTSEQGRKIQDFEGGTPATSIATCGTTTPAWTKIYYNNVSVAGTSVPQEPGAASNPAAIGINFAPGLVPVFVAALPTDPQMVSTYDTGYTICKSSGSGRISINAPSAEGLDTQGSPKVILVTR